MRRELAAPSEVGLPTALSDETYWSLTRLLLLGPSRRRAELLILRAPIR